MSVNQHAVENQIAVMAADEAVQNLLKLGGKPREAIAEWHRVYHDIQRIARMPDSGGWWSGS
jgi:hypothetical protein